MGWGKPQLISGFRNREFRYSGFIMERYLPASDFLNAILNDDVTFGESQFGRANLARLLTFVTDPEVSNRDWATFLISGLPDDSPEIHRVLLMASEDEDADVRDEAIVGLARRDRKTAITLIRPLLSKELGIVVLEAATILGEPSLVPALREIEAWEGGSEKVRHQLALAIAACEAGLGQDIPKQELNSQHRLSD